MNRHQQQQPQRQQQHVPKPQGSEWFAGAPASKLLIAFSVVLFLVIHDRTASWQLDSYAMSKSGNTYRYITSKGTFLSTGELIVGTALQVFLFRKYERELGTRKFVIFLLFVNALCVAQEFLLLQLLMARNLVLDLPNPIRWQYAGPYPLIGGLFTLFHCYAPRMHPRFVSVLGFHFSEKAFYYLWCFHLIGSGGWNTVVPAVTGIVAALLYLKVLQDHFDVPDFIVRAVQPVFERLGLLEAPVAVRGVHATAAAAAVAAAQVPQHRPVERPAAQEIPMPDPDPSAVEQLTAMGFPRPQVMEALRQSHNNVEHAANRLLSGS